MYIKCNHCGNKIPVVVSSWDIFPENDQLTSAMHIGRFGELSINSQLSFKIKPHASSYRCRDCGYEKEYPSNEILCD